MSKKVIARKGKIKMIMASFPSRPFKGMVTINDLTGRQHVKEVREHHVIIK